MSVTAPAYLAAIYDGKVFLGSGVLVAPDWLLTCGHVVESHTRFRVCFDGIETTGTVVARHEKDLALLKLEHRGGAAPRWSNENPCYKEIELCGFVAGSFASTTGKVLSTLLDGGRNVRRADAECSGAGGMSGGVAMCTIGGHPHCVGMIGKGGETAYKSVLIGGGEIAPFLGKNRLQLPGWPVIPSAPAQEPDDSKYRAWLIEETGWIDIRGFKVGSGDANRLRITDAYIPLLDGQKKPIEDLLQAQKLHLVVQGEAGSGKSTFVKHVAHRFATAGERTVLYLRVVDLDRHIKKQEEQPHSPASPDDPTWIAHYLAAQDWGLDEAFFRRRMHDATTLVLLDGLDEALTEARRKNLAALFGKAARKFACSFVLTTRPGAYVGEAQPLRFTTCAIAALEDEAVARFVDDWSRFLHPGDPARSEKLAADLKTQVSATPEVREMAKSPMMLTALAVIHWNNKRLPDDRAELYESILDWLVTQREHRPGRVSARKCLEILRCLALGMQTHPDGRMKQAELGVAIDLIGEYLKGKAALDFLEQEQLDSGIIVQRGGGVEFLHLTFQEYLATKELLENRSEAEQRDILLLKNFRYSVDWREFLRLTAICCKAMGARRTTSLFRTLLDDTGPSLADRARTVSLISTMLGEVRDFELGDSRYLDHVRAMDGLFDGAADGQGLDLWSRATAAEAWERLGDLSRLRLPGDSDYWVRVGKFEIGRCPVTVHEYELFVSSGACPRKPLDWEEQRRYPHRPVAYLSWHDAVAYCKWCGNGARLPTEEEWYAAAAGTGKRREYPWGDEEPTGELANFGYIVHRPTPVGLFPAGATPGTGIVDMAGNVWEWTADGDEKRRWLRGGSFNFGASYLRASDRLVVHPDYRYDYIGFRCARDVFP